MSTAEISALLRGYFDAFQLSKWQDFGALLDDNFTYVTDNCTQQTKAEFLAFLAANHWPVVSYEISDLHVLPSLHQDLIVAMYDVKFVGTDSIVMAKETTVVRRGDEGRYRVVHSHTSNRVTS